MGRYERNCQPIDALENVVTGMAERDTSWDFHGANSSLASALVGLVNYPSLGLLHFLLIDWSKRLGLEMGMLSSLAMGSTWDF